MSLRSQIRDLYYVISGDMEHGECFYDLDMLNEFCSNLDKMKELSLQYYNENKSEAEEDESE